MRFLSQISRWPVIFLLLVAGSLVGSFLAARTGSAPPHVREITPILILASGIAAVFEPWYRTGRRNTLVAIGALVALGVAVEIVGVTTGFPFGRYEYTSRWQPVIEIASGVNFPLSVPFAWALVVGASYMFFAGLGFWRAVVSGALTATAIDVLMEPTMTGNLSYWRWPDHGPLPGGVPISNAIGWFATALAGGAILWAFGARGRQARAASIAVLVGYMGLVAGLSAIGRT